METDLHNRYQRFAAAVGRGDVVALSELVDKANFRAVLPGGPEEGMDFTLFIPEMERRRAPFSDFGRNVRTHRVVVGENQVVVYYTMTVTNDGTLASWSAASTLPPSGRQISFTSMDMVTFGADGKVTELIVVSDRLPTLLSMGGFGPA